MNTAGRRADSAESTQAFCRLEAIHLAGESGDQTQRVPRPSLDNPDERIPSLLAWMGARNRAAAQPRGRFLKWRFRNTCLRKRPSVQNGARRRNLVNIDYSIRSGFPFLRHRL